MNKTKVLTYVWPRSIRLFHWINVITISLLIVIGLIIFNSKTLGVTVDAKILLKTIHISIGYIFAINLIIRLVIGFIGTSNEKWSRTLPFMKGYKKELTEFRRSPKQAYTGHNPLGKLMVLALLIAMIIQMATGLILAGTDIYYPPLGQHFAKSIAVNETQLDAIKPYSKVNVDDERYKQLREFRSPIITTHLYAFYALLVLIPLHILGVLVSDEKSLGWFLQ
ncbi:cytochrome b/b6 domain-containing protein [Thalassotalea piscium]|uniref:Cytochrome b n=1 Tax=Thalassotalea piscium TaxID=1230533 RepID=A0A7X0NDY7_9GAMM|nr:cytochrome b/b6 domain-containing protein [Thalassotalea piscium]MBB6541683.1 cytochrome b [Thalassotalea piscium]